MRRLCIHRLPLVVLALALALGAAPTARAQISMAEVAARREALAAQIDSGLVLAFGGRTPVGEYPFTQLAAFRYLTNYLEPDAAFLLVKRGGKVRGVLFVPPVDPRLALYNGFPPDTATLRRETGLGVRPLDALSPLVDSLVTAGLPLYTLDDFATADYEAEDSLTRGRSFVQALTSRHPGLTVLDAHPWVNELRARKSAAEIALIRHAIAITVEAEREAMRFVESRRNEYEVQALIEYAFRRRGADGPSFNSIIGSGPNSTEYHHMKNDRMLQSGEVVVMDVGAAYQGYAADVTRTVPVSGRFSVEQRTIYQLVRDAQAAAERVLRPGAPWQNWRDSAAAVEARGLAQLGLIESADATFDPPWGGCDTRPAGCRQAFLFMAHGLGHGIGLEVHDPPAAYRGSGTFAPGNVVTIEPGVYISTNLLDILPDTPKNRAMIAKIRPVVEQYQNIGIRIEDDYLVTETGSEWLSRAPREIAEVEAAMDEGGPR